jgi:hypothetical protein
LGAGVAVAVGVGEGVEVGGSGVWVIPKGIISVEAEAAVETDCVPIAGLAQLVSKVSMTREIKSVLCIRILLKTTTNETNII